ncbi:MAG: HAMP domain-containing sensor histidine kinase [Bryobacteraceae bacterium]
MQSATGAKQPESSAAHTDLDRLRLENESLRRQAETVAVSNAHAVERLEALEMARRQLERSNRELMAQRERLADALETARRAEDSKAAFLAAVSHELRTPLAAIIGYAELMEESSLDRELGDMAADAAKIRGSGRRLLALVNDVLDFTRVGSGRMPMVISTFRPEMLLRELEDELRFAAEESGNRLVSVCDATVGRVTADRVRIHQVLTNLLSNACKFTHEGQIALSVSRERAGGAEWVEWTVSDSGIGVHPEDHERIFEAFSQVDTSRSRRYSGTGLGLAVSRGLCVLMGGTLTVESELGRGATFTARIPDPVAG